MFLKQPKNTGSPVFFGVNTSNLAGQAADLLR